MMGNNKDLREPPQNVGRSWRWINDAYLPARGSVEGPRSTPQRLRAKLRGCVPAQTQFDRALDGCVYVEIRGELGYFGLLAVSLIGSTMDSPQAGELRGVVLQGPR